MKDEGCQTNRNLLDDGTRVLDDLPIVVVPDVGCDRSAGEFLVRKRGEKGERQLRRRSTRKVESV